MRPATSARGRTATISTEIEPAGVEPTLEALRHGELEVLGGLVGSTNNAMVVRVWPRGTHPSAFGGPLAEEDLLGVWKPTIGERPLFDFPIGTLTRREVAAYLVSEAFGWRIVPPTLLRDGPHGEGMLQRWIDVDPAADVIDMVNGADPRLRRVAVLDAVLNNTDRKAGHLLPVEGGHVHAVDHGVTFSIEPKLRTVLWHWAGDPLDAEETGALERVRRALGEPGQPGPLATALGELLFIDEVDVTRVRIDDLLAAGVFPGPSPDWPAIPWPPV